MSWWNEILGLLREEVAGPEKSADLAPNELASAKQAETVLKRTERELATSRARAEAARRRLLRTQDQLRELSQQKSQTAQFRERLTSLAKAVTHESELVETFDAHIERLSELQARVHHQLSKFERDVQMVRSAHTAVALNETVLNAKQGKPRASKTAQPSRAVEKPEKDRFRGGPDDKVIDRLKRRPKS